MEAEDLLSEVGGNTLEVGDALQAGPGQQQVDQQTQHIHHLVQTHLWFHTGFGVFCFKNFTLDHIKCNLG